MLTEKIEILKLLITEEIIKSDFENRKTGSEPLIKMTKMSYLKRLMNLLKILEE